MTRLRFYAVSGRRPHNSMISCEYLRSDREIAAAADLDSFWTEILEVNFTRETN